MPPSWRSSKVSKGLNVGLIDTARIEKESFRSRRGLSATLLMPSVRLSVNLSTGKEYWCWCLHVTMKRQWVDAGKKAISWAKMIGKSNPKIWWRMSTRPKIVSGSRKHVNICTVMAALRSQELYCLIQKLVELRPQVKKFLFRTTTETTCHPEHHACSAKPWKNWTPLLTCNHWISQKKRSLLSSTLARNSKLI